MRATSRRIEALTAERSRAFLPALREIDAELRTTFRSLVADGSCCLEFSTQPQILFAEGVQVRALYRGPGALGGGRGRDLARSRPHR